MEINYFTENWLNRVFGLVVFQRQIVLVTVEFNRLFDWWTFDNVLIFTPHNKTITKFCGIVTGYTYFFLIFVKAFRTI